MKFGLFIFFIFVSTSIAGCPARSIQNADVEILECQFDNDEKEDQIRKNKKSGAAMLVKINYVEESWMEPQSAKNMKSKIFFYSEDKDVCKKFVKGKKFCMNLSQWCIMAGNPPGGANFTVETEKEGKCPPGKKNQRVPLNQRVSPVETSKLK